MAVQATPSDPDGLLELGAQAQAEEPAKRHKSLTIGAVCKALAQEFPDISISKIRYLEDQKLLTPRRTPGGYRLYTQGDVARLRTILRMQRDEFLPLRVIRQELAAGRPPDTAPIVSDFWRFASSPPFGVSSMSSSSASARVVGTAISARGT